MKTFALFMTCCCLLVAAYPSDLEFLESDHLSRQKRQSGWAAMDLASRHNDRNGNPLPVGKPNFSYDLNGSGKNGRNYNVNAGLGLGTVLYRSKNKAHSLGAGVYGSQTRGRYQGYRYKSPVNWGAGLGYRFRF